LFKWKRALIIFYVKVNKWEGYEEGHNVFLVADHLENQFANLRGSRMRLDEAKGDARPLERNTVIEETSSE
tara:strand:- start:108 stop:320 length:213 start_codon:yes stop_codon:yes gene_type:complete